MEIWLESQDNLDKHLVRAEKIDLENDTQFYVNGKFLMAEYSNSRIAKKVLKRLKETMDITLYAKTKRYKEIIKHLGEPSNVIVPNLVIFTFPTNEEAKTWID